MKRNLSIILCLALTLIMVLPALAGKKEDTEALVNKAIKYAADNGVDATIKAVNDKNGPFIKGSLYVFISKTEDGIMVAHPFKPQLIGKNLNGLKDVNGKHLFVEFIKKAKAGGGWVDYLWPKPNTNKPVPKSSFVRPIPGSGLFAACGYYK